MLTRFLSLRAGSRFVLSRRMSLAVLEGKTPRTVLEGSKRETETRVAKFRLLLRQKEGVLGALRCEFGSSEEKTRRQERPTDSSVSHLVLILQGNLVQSLGHFLPTICEFSDFEIEKDASQRDDELPTHPALFSLFVDAAVYASKVDANSASLGTYSLALINRSFPSSHPTCFFIFQRISRFSSSRLPFLPYFSLLHALLLVTAAISRVGFGILVDANPRFTVPLILLSSFGSGLTVFLLWGLAAGTPPGLLVFGTIYGIFSGGFSSLWAGMIRQVGSE